MSVRINITLDTSGLNRLLSKMNLSKNNEVRKAITIISYKIEGDAKESIQRGSRSGILYTRRSITHRASAAGEFPKSDTGSLVANITSEFSFNGLESTVGSRIAAPHGFYLEYGTSKMAPRPWLFPTVIKNKKFIENTYKNVLIKVVKK